MTAVAVRRPARPEEDALYPSFAERPHTMPELLQWRAGREPQRPAVVAADGRMTFGEWAERAARGAHRLVQAGVEPDERVGLWGTNQQGCDWIAALLAIQYAGGVPVPLSSGTAVVNSTDRLARLAVRHVVAGAAAGPLPGFTVHPLALAEPGTPELPAPRADPQRCVVVFHTSGTTGVPKAALMSHESIVFTAAMTEGHILAAPCGIDPLGPDDTMQTSIPLHTSSAVEHYILISLWTGCRIVCEPKFDPVQTLRTAAAERSTIWLTVPAMMMLTADLHPDPVAGLDLRAVWHMGSVVSRECVESIARMLPDCAVLNLYSLTESGAGIVTTHQRDSVEKPGATGRAVPPARIRVVDAAGNPLVTGEVGEVQFNSPYMFDGYDENPEATAASFTEDGWFRSGDGGWLDDDGLLWLTGRLGDVIIRGGLNIDPRSVEERILAFAGVRDAVLAAVPHRVLGSDIIGLIEADDGIDVDALRRHCLATLPHNEVPRLFCVVDEIPRNDFGKLDRRRAREIALAMQPHQHQTDEQR
jgi:acyl-CoA synthetase (AMP-forming)/AMP-acid ligase II